MHRAALQPSLRGYIDVWIVSPDIRHACFLPSPAPPLLYKIHNKIRKEKKKKKEAALITTHLNVVSVWHCVSLPYLTMTRGAGLSSSTARALLIVMIKMRQFLSLLFVINREHLCMEVR